MELIDLSIFFGTKERQQILTNYFKGLKVQKFLYGFDLLYMIYW